MNSLNPEPHVFIVFGGTGDLMKRKLLPAIRNLSRGRLENVPFRIVGVGRHELGTLEFLNRLLEGEETDGSMREWCAKRLSYLSADPSRSEDFEKVGKYLSELEKSSDIAQNRVLYLALPPTAFMTTIQGLGKAGLNRSKGWTRIVVEKPFGRDLESARSLNRELYAHFSEEQIYRIDHYLGKETVQNLLVFRFANPVFESIWNRDRVQKVEITVAETLGLENRAGYYDRSGALRDMVQNHLTQLLCLTAMEVPATLEANFIRDEKVKVLRSIPRPAREDVVFGQYCKGSIEGRAVRGYREESGVGDESQTETFVAARLQLANWRWQGVPFILKTGKRLPQRLTQIRVLFRCPPVSLFHPFKGCAIESNQIVITLQPDEGFDLHFEVKTPGQDISMRTERLRFRYSEAFGELPDAYETLLLDILTGDQTLFVRGDETEVAWKLYDHLLTERPDLHPYEAGTWGPRAAELLGR